MTGNKLIAIIAAMMAGLAALAVAGLYIDWERMFEAPPVEEAGTPPSAVERPASPQTADAPNEPEAKTESQVGAPTPPAEPTTVPTFDVVVIEPSGEGVIAGRAAPGWKVSVQSGGVQVAEVKADLQGEWSVVLDKPLPSGDHALSLKIISPDGTRAVSSQETVKVAVGKATPSQATGAVGSPPSGSQAGAIAEVTQPKPPAEETSSSAPAAGAGPTPPEDPNAPRALARSEQPPASNVPAPLKPKIVFKTVDYVDSGSGTGTVTITGTSEPGAKLSVFYDNQPLVETKAGADGHWSVEVSKTLPFGQHQFRVERSGAPPELKGTAFVALERVEPKPEPPAPVVASKETGAGPSPQASGESSSNPLVYVIRKGDTLWAIAKRYLGSGLRYPTIFEGNRGVIHDPDLIHPQQEVKVPATETP